MWRVLFAAAHRSPNSMPHLGCIAENSVRQVGLWNMYRSILKLRDVSPSPSPWAR